MHLEQAVVQSLLFYAWRSLCSIYSSPGICGPKVSCPLATCLFLMTIVLLEWVIYANNPDYQRKNALFTLSGDWYRQDYIAGNIGNHILKGDNARLFTVE
jgi:hypothetical protein